MKRAQSSPARAAMKRLCAMLGLILAVMLSVTLYVQNLMMQNHYTHIKDISSFRLNLSGLQFPELDLSGLLSNLKSDKIGGSGSDILNILLVGQDRREGEERARSDSMILCTYHKKTNQLTMTSFLRDLYVPIPGHGENRINAAYALGGMELLEDTLEENFNLHIDGCVEVDFSQFADIIDLLGGIDLSLRQDEADYINEETGSALSEGTHHLSGQQALVYSRIRSLDADGDFSRTNRQRKVLSAMMDICKDAELPALMKLTEKIFPMVSTDMSSAKLLKLALDLLPGLSKVEVASQHVPEAGSYSDESINGMSVLVADTDAVRKMLKQTLLGTEE